MSGINFYNTSESIAYNNKIYNNIAFGIAIGTTSREITVFNNTIKTNNNYGVRIFGVVNITVNQNKISSNYNPGIFLRNSQSCNITANTIYLNSKGIHIENSYFSLVADNFIENNDGTGIYFQGTNNNNTLSNNTIANNMEYGVILQHGTEDNKIEYNVFLNNTNYAIYLHSSSVDSLIIWNDFIDNNLGGYSQAYDSGSGNNFTYNYWDDWNAPDTNYDGYV
ncbi:unnamed protein product, partial [marine sediment metagenome]